MGFFLGNNLHVFCLRSFDTRTFFCANNYSQIKISLLDWDVTCGIGAAGF